MAYPGESVVNEYRDYILRWSLGEETGEKLSKDEWLKKRLEAKKKKQGEEKEEKPEEAVSSILKPGGKGILKA